MNDLVTLQKLEQSRLSIMEIKTLDEIKKVIDQSEALKAYAKSAQLSAEIQASVAELNVRATRRLGEITAGLEKAKVTGNQHTGKVRTSDITKTETLEGFGISRQRASEAEKLAVVPEELFERKLSEAKAATEKITKSLFDEIIAKQRIVEEERAFDRVARYRRTGIKPKGWIDGKDDDLNRQADERDARLETYWQEKADKQKRQQESANGKFLETLRAYLKGLANDDLRAGACNAVIKECRKILGGLGK